MNRILFMIITGMGLVLHQCGAIKEIQKPEVPELTGMEGFSRQCLAVDTIQSLLISKADAILTFDDERYEVTVTLYSIKDSVIYLSAVNSGYEIIRATVDKDSIKVINRLNKVVYYSPLQRRFGYQYPVSFGDLQNIVSPYYLCDDRLVAMDDKVNSLQFDFDETNIKKRILMDRELLKLKTFEFYHQRTSKYLMGERIENGLKIYSNFMITEFEIVTSGGTVSYNQDIEVKMDVNPRRYTFTELR